MEEYEESDDTREVKIPKLEFLAFRKISFSDIHESLVNFYRKIKVRYIYNQLSKPNFFYKSINYDMIDFNIIDHYNDDCILDIDYSILCERDIKFWFCDSNKENPCSISFTNHYASHHDSRRMVKKFYTDNKITNKDRVFNLNIYNEELISETYSSILVIRDDNSIEFYDQSLKQNKTGYITDRYFPDDNRIYFTDIIKLIKLK
jgi:hypothetical protein